MILRAESCLFHFLSLVLHRVFIFHYGFAIFAQLIVELWNLYLQLFVIDILIRFIFFKVRHILLDRIEMLYRLQHPLFSLWFEFLVFHFYYRLIRNVNRLSRNKNFPNIWAYFHLAKSSLRDLSISTPFSNNNLFFLFINDLVYFSFEHI